MNTLHSKKYTNIYGKEITKFSSSYLCGGGAEKGWVREG